MLRISVMGLIVMDVIPHLGIAVRIWSGALSVMLAALSFVGLFTPYLWAFCCVLEVTAFLNSGMLHAIHIFALVTTTTALGILGPGAYSCDALLFGPRLILTSRDD